MQEVLSQWEDEKKKIEMAGKALAERKSLQEKIKMLEKDLEKSSAHIDMREEEYSIIASIDKVKDEGYGVPALLMETMTKYPNRRIIVRDSIAALTRVLHPTNANFVYEKGGVDRVLQGLHDHKEDAQIQANGCRFLWQILIQGNTPPILRVLEEKECLMFVLDAMQRHADERHLHYNAVGLACLLIPKLRKEIEANHEDVKREYGMPDKKKNAGTTSLPSLTRKSAGRVMVNNLTKNNGVGMRALKKMSKKTKFKDMPSAAVLRSRQTTSDTVRMIFAAMDYRDGDGLAATWCCTVLCSIIFKRAEQEVAHKMPGPQETPSLVRKHALDTIKRSVEGAEKGFIYRMVHLLRSYRGRRHAAMQGMVCLMIVQLLPDDPVKKTKYLKLYKEFQVPQSVMDVCKQEHAHRDKALLAVLTEILNYFAFPVPEDPKKKKKFGMLFAR